mgnify:FL=1
MIQRQSCLFLPVVHTIVLARYKVNRVCSFFGTSQYMYYCISLFVWVQCQSRIFFRVRRSLSLSEYSVKRVGSFGNVTVYHFQGTVSIESILSGTSKYNIVRIQRQSSWFFRKRHSISFSGYSVDRVYSFRNVKV